MNAIPDDLIFNWNHHLLPVDDWTMEKGGSENVVIKGSDDKQHIAVILAVILADCYTHASKNLLRGQN